MATNWAANLFNRHGFAICTFGFFFGFAFALAVTGILGAEVFGFAAPADDFAFAATFSVTSADFAAAFLAAVPSTALLTLAAGFLAFASSFLRMSFFLP